MSSSSWSAPLSQSAAAARTAVQSFILSLALSAVASAQTEDVTALSLEELGRVEVTTASRKAQSLGDTPAAAFVITAEDIHRSGATTVPDALRMVPGVQVAQFAGGRWAVSARGFNGRFANALQVLLDGRVVYSPLFSGVMWEAEDIPLEDVERIEVIRGPGGVMWGSNAVNGVINIITKNAGRTQGGLVAAAAGNFDRGIGTARYGTQLGESTYLRVQAFGRKRDGAYDATGSNESDGLIARRGGFRLDSAPGGYDRLMLSGDVYNIDSRDEWNPPSLVPPYFQMLPIQQGNDGAHLLGRWERTLAGGGEIALQGSVAHTRLEAGPLTENRTTYDIDFQHRFRAGSRHDLMWGAAYRHSGDDIDSNGFISFSPEHGTFTLASVFVQDDFTLVPERLRLVTGMRLEHNDYTGNEPQPSVRLLWTPSSTQTVWAAWSRAVRIPSRAELAATIDLVTIPPGTPDNPGPLPVLVQAMPSGNRVSERLNAAELGYRIQLEPRASIDVATFYNHYDRRSSAVFGTPTPMLAAPIPYVLQPAASDWTGRADTYGVETSIDWRPLTRWRLQLSHTWMHIIFFESDQLAGQGDRQLATGTTPRHQLSLRSMLELAPRWQFDAWVRRIGGLEYGAIPAYTALDLRLAWQASKNLELSLVGQNLLDRRHPEFYTDLLNTPLREIPRAGYLKALWRF